MQRRLRQPSHAAPSSSTIVHASSAAHTHLTAPIGYARASQVRIELLVSAGDDSEDAGALLASYDALAILLLPLLCGLSRLTGTHPSHVARRRALAHVAI